MTARDEISEVVVFYFIFYSSSSSSGEDKTFRTLLLDTFVLVNFRDAQFMSLSF